MSIIRAGRTLAETPHMPKSNMPKKEDDVLLPMGQKKPTMHRYRLQVDGQTKASYPTVQEAETAGKEIKTSHPICRLESTTLRRAK